MSGTGRAPIVWKAGTVVAARVRLFAGTCLGFGLGLLLANALTLSAQTVSPRPQAATAPTTGVQATTVAIASPSAVTYDTAGNLYVALRDDHLVRRIDTLGFVSVVVGTGEQ